MAITIEEAIKTLGQQHNFRDTPCAIKLDDAIRLGISALVRIKTLREQNGLPTILYSARQVMRPRQYKKGG